MKRSVGVMACCLLGIAGCSRDPRSSSYFEAHPDETSRVLSDCRSGVHRGAECDNALLADAKRKSDARLELYKSGFK
jgi:hypothetical protein